MNKESGKNKKLGWAIGLVAGLGVLSIAYAALSSTLYINGSGSVDEGHVFFVEYAATPTAPYSSSTLGEFCTQHAIGSTAYTDATTSGNFSRYNPADLIRSTGTVSKDDAPFNGDVAKSLGVVGDMEITDSKNGSSVGDKDHRKNDTLTISNIALYDYGSYVVYKLILKNTAPNPMVLKDPGTITFTSPSGTDITANLEGYLLQSFTPTASATTFTYPSTEAANQVSKFSNGQGVSEPSSAAYNYLPANSGTPATTTWYLMVKHKDQGSTPVDITNGTFNVTLTPVWEALNND